MPQHTDTDKPFRETPQAAAAFAEYCAFGEGRTLDKLAKIIAVRQKRNKSTILGQLGRWSSHHHWQERVIAYDVARIEEKRKAREHAVEQMNEEHAKIGRAGVLQAVKRIQELIDEGKLGGQSAVTLLKTASDLERLARGEAIGVYQQNQTGELRIVVEKDTEV